jgi:hypothetical protein
LIIVCMGIRSHGCLLPEVDILKKRGSIKSLFV